jgi:hypothetical protein
MVLKRYLHDNLIEAWLGKCHVIMISCRCLKNPTVPIMVIPHLPSVQWLEAVAAVTTCVSARSHELAPISEKVLLSSVDKLIDSAPLLTDSRDAVSSRPSVKRSRSHQAMEDHSRDVKRFLMEPHRSTGVTAQECVKLQSHSIFEVSKREQVITGEARRFRLQTLRLFLL